MPNSGGYLSCGTSPPPWAPGTWQEEDVLEAKKRKWWEFTPRESWALTTANHGLLSMLLLRQKVDRGKVVSRTTHHIRKQQWKRVTLPPLPTDTVQDSLCRKWSCLLTSVSVLKTSQTCSEAQPPNDSRFSQVKNWHQTHKPLGHNSWHLKNRGDPLPANSPPLLPPPQIS